MSHPGCEDEQSRSISSFSREPSPSGRQGGGFSPNGGASRPACSSPLAACSCRSLLASGGNFLWEILLRFFPMACFPFSKSVPPSTPPRLLPWWFSNTESAQRIGVTFFNSHNPCV